MVISVFTLTLVYSILMYILQSELFKEQSKMIGCVLDLSDLLTFFVLLCHRWVREFLNDENRGLDILVEYLSFAQCAVM